MTERKYNTCLLLVLLSGLLVLFGYSKTLTAQETSIYRFGVFPHMSPLRIERKYAPVALAFGTLLKKPVKLSTATKMDKFRDRVMKGTFDIALIPPLDIVPIVDEGGYIPLARRKSTPASIVVTEDSSIKKVADLQGKTLGLPDGTPVNIILQLTLNDRGFVGGNAIDFKLFNNVQACLHKLLLKSVDACGSASGTAIKMFQNKMNIKFREIMQTEAFPHMLFVAHPRLSSAERHTLTQLILGQDIIEKGQNTIQAPGKYADYTSYKSTDYDVIRQYRQRWVKHAKNTP